MGHLNTIFCLGDGNLNQNFKSSNTKGLAILSSIEASGKNALIEICLSKMEKLRFYS